MRLLSKCLAGIAAMTICLAVSEDALACHDLGGGADTVLCFTSIHGGLSVATFNSANVYFASRRAWATPQWAWPQLVLGSFGTWGGAIAGIALTAKADEEPHQAANYAWGAGLLALGSFHGVFAIWSLENYRAPSGDAAAAPPQATWRLPLLSVTPVKGGAVVTASF